ncbi:pentatricopeptide repeat-containing protein At1g12775, mitochondrial-like [Cornus florida]|uniref:pentatricopeptide repeat-containing protein At1g12775, mitochondrial-like n=1 Tax=Cornus florida TaxID=4283 RepID=UPI00289A4F7E|nr:pentatricopeptide repeat-containing protein At1g12775, mitochondrial-like [Cornus florida]
MVISGAAYAVSRKAAFAIQNGNFPRLFLLIHPIASVRLCSQSSIAITNQRDSKRRTQTQFGKSFSDKCKSGFSNLDDALTLFNNMLQTKPIPSIVCFNQLLGSLAKMKHYWTVISLFKRMDSSGVIVIKPDLFSLNIVVNCFCHLNRLGFAFSVLGKIFKLGFEPSYATFTTLICGLFADGQMDKAVKFVDEIVSIGFQPNHITYGTLINGLCKTGRRKSV